MLFSFLSLERARFVSHQSESKARRGEIIIRVGVAIITTSVSPELKEYESSLMNIGRATTASIATTRIFFCAFLFPFFLFFSFHRASLPFVETLFRARGKTSRKCISRVDHPLLGKERFYDTRVEIDGGR